MVNFEKFKIQFKKINKDCFRAEEGDENYRNVKKH
jgi:hypothetical protein